MVTVPKGVVSFRVYIRAGVLLQCMYIRVYMQVSMRQLITYVTYYVTYLVYTSHTACTARKPFYLPPYILYQLHQLQNLPLEYISHGHLTVSMTDEDPQGQTSHCNLSSLLRDCSKMSLGPPLEWQ